MSPEITIAGYDLKYDGDNRRFVVDWLVPRLKLSDKMQYVMVWAYENGWELHSDGETFVEDEFLGGSIKCPAGVCHDSLNRTPHHLTPNGTVWTRWSTNRVFREIHKALAVFEVEEKHDLNKITKARRKAIDFALRWRRWVGVTVTGYLPFVSWWK